MNNKLYKLKLKDYYGISVDSNPESPKGGFMIYEEEIIIILDRRYPLYDHYNGDHFGVKAFNVTQNKIFYTNQISNGEFVEL